MSEQWAGADALLESLAVQGTASAEGFDWPAVAGVLAKVDEEVQEIRDALVGGDAAHARRELGDLLLVLVNLARFLDANPRDELHAATRRFANRFEMLKAALASEGKTIKNCSPAELERWWQQIKPGADEALRKGLDKGGVPGANSST